MRMRTLSIAVAIAITAISPARADEPLTLRFAIAGANPMSTTYTKVFLPWMERIEADGGGAVKLQAFFNIANFQNVYDRVVNAVTDIGYGGTGAMGGKFPGASVVELASDVVGSREAAGAYWKVFEDGLIATDYAEVRPLAFFAFPKNMLTSPKPITSLADVKGMRVAVLSKGAGEIVERLGGAAMSSNPAAFYETLQRKTADAVIVGWNGLMVFKLTEVTNNHLDLGLDSGGGHIVMNKGVYAGLPAVARAAIDKNAGAAASQMLGASWDKLYGDAEEAVRRMPGQTIVTPTPADRERFKRDVIDPMTEEWVKRTPNGAAILAAYRGEAARLKQAR